MRRASQNVEIVNDEKGNFMGVSLGYDYCAEHEWGIKGIKREFGINSEKVGVDGRTITKGNVIYKEKGDLGLLITDLGYRSLKEEEFDKCVPRDLEYRREDKKLHTAWNEESFCVITDKDLVKQLYDAFQNLNIVFAFVSDMPAFGGSSLCILIKDRIPEETLEKMRYVDQQALDLIAYEENIGIAKLKTDKFYSCYNNDFDKTKHKYWMALSPRWINYQNENPQAKVKANTEYDIQYWVNYGDNETYGWFTVEQIKQWLETPELRLKTLGGNKG